MSDENVDAGLNFTSKWMGAADVRVEGTNSNAMLINVSKRPNLPPEIPIGFPVKTQTVGVEIDGLFYGLQVRYLAHTLANPEIKTYTGEPISRILALATWGITRPQRSAQK